MSIEKRRQLRKNLTPAEAALWSLLKNKQLKGLKFRRQHPIDMYIVDFCEYEHKLIIELDGEVHNNPANKNYDSERQHYLESKGYKILRFENKEVFENIEHIFRCIEEAI